MGIFHAVTFNRNRACSRMGSGDPTADRRFRTEVNAKLDTVISRLDKIEVITTKVSIFETFLSLLNIPFWSYADR